MLRIMNLTPDVAVNSLLRVGVMLFLTAGMCHLRAGIRSLPPSAFPELPANVAGELDRRECRIPQPERHKRNNVIQGEFLKPAQTDWAILCMTKQVTSLLVFENGSEQSPVEIERKANGSAARWYITPVSEQTLVDYLPAWKPSRPRPKLDHQGILSGIGPLDLSSGRFSDAAAETTIYFFDSEKWTKLVTINVN
jgi:hypothetical protein